MTSLNRWYKSSNAAGSVTPFTIVRVVKFVISETSIALLAGIASDNILTPSLLIKGDDTNKRSLVEPTISINLFLHGDNKNSYFISCCPGAEALFRIADVWIIQPRDF